MAGAKDRVGVTEDVTTKLGDALAEELDRRYAGEAASVVVLPPKPSESAPKAKWQAYAAALGLDMTGTASEWTKPQLIEWCG